MLFVERRLRCACAGLTASGACNAGWRSCVAGLAIESTARRSRRERRGVRRRPNKSSSSTPSCLARSHWHLDTASAGAESSVVVTGRTVPGYAPASPTRHSSGDRDGWWVVEYEQMTGFARLGKASPYVRTDSAITLRWPRATEAERTACRARSALVVATVANLGRRHTGASTSLMLRKNAGRIGARVIDPASAGSPPTASQKGVLPRAVGRQRHLATALEHEAHIAQQDSPS